MPTLQLKKLTTTSFMGINLEAPSIIDFSQYNNKKITRLSGDQGAGKTSTILSILYACGQSFDFKLENFVNLKDGALSGSFEFQSGTKDYKVTYSKTKFVLNRLYKDSDEPESAGKWIPESDPKTLLKKLIGHVATSPMFLKEVKGSKQIEWLYEILNVPADIKAKETTLKEELKIANSSYTATNKLYTEIKSALNQDEFYTNWEQSEKLYSEEKKIESVKDKFDTANLKRNQYVNAQAKVASISNDINTKEQKISELELLILSLKSEKETLENSLREGNKFLDENGNAKQDYEKAYNDFSEINNYILNRNKWLDVVRKKSEMDEAETLLQEFEVRKKDKKVELKSLVKKILPDIKGLEVETDEQIENIKPVGIYIDGKTPSQLSESELFDFYFQICMSQGVNMVFVENLSSFGSATIKTLNALAKKGVYVFGTMMDRKQKTLKIEILEEIE